VFYIYISVAYVINPYASLRYLRIFLFVHAFAEISKTFNT